MIAKRVLLLAIAAAGGLLILAWSQTWFDLELVDERTLTVPGTTAASGVLAAGIAGLAVSAALTIAPVILRHVLGALAAVVGGIGAGVAIVAMTDPVQASAALITEETGQAGTGAIRALIAAAHTTAWPWVAVVGGVLAMAAGAAVIVTARRWPAGGSRYERTTTRPDDWDALTGGDDPTR